MSLDTTRRGFLAGLLGLTVIAVVPRFIPDAAAAEAPAVDPFAIQAPEGTTYQWVRSALLGEPDPANIEVRLSNGWRFVSPSTHPQAPTATVGDAVEWGGLVLMERPTADVQAQLAQEQAAFQERYPAAKSQEALAEQADLFVDNRRTFDGAWFEGIEKA